MKTINFHSVMTAHGAVLRAEFKGMRLETDGVSWLNILDNEGRCEACVIDEDGDVIAESGECVTQAWTAQDWSDLTTAVNYKPANN